ncbi:uncharacterized protein LOC129224262 [Uloborus diversus]|uniref:uncharacterized protein LOC129224262 n=1 Tax=Uloborus diversus TaxID=327109 RepID=UPI00240915F6|nr:uncharacterized protein LOC129224262 [Uloborus diversus]
MVYHPYVIFSDFECMVKPVSTCYPSTSKSFTTPTEEHVAYSYSILCLDQHDSIVFKKYYCGENAVENFLGVLKKLCKTLLKKMKLVVPLSESNFHKNSKCHICDKIFTETDKVVRDHCHFTGIFRGFAHNHCNLNYRIRYFIPVIFHNLKGYDSHLILKHLSGKYGKSIRIIPVNTQKFTTSQIDEIKFIDSMQFLNPSLATLVENLNNSNHDFKIFNSYYANEKNRFLLKRKGVFPYSYFSNPEILKKPGLPPKHEFFNKLTNKPIADEDYEFALLVFRTFNCKFFSDYLKLYQELDVLLLAECVSFFRRKCFLCYGLDIFHFISLADFTWNAGLKFTKAELELFADVNMYIWIENSIRGGICFLGKRYACANNRYIPETYNKNEKESYILALDANNLYGHSMSQYLPIGAFKWLSDNEIKKFNVLNTISTSEVGYILEVDITYSNEAQITQDWPLAPDHITINYDMLSNYQKKLLKSGDTDSFYLEIVAPHVFEDLQTIFKPIIDSSNFPKDHYLFNSENSGRLGALKHESTDPIK